MLAIKRPVFMTGENPGLTLFAPGSGEAVAILSYWHCTDSPWGAGNVLILWGSGSSASGIYADNLELARILTERLTRHFPDFRAVPLERLALVDAEVEHAFDGTRYRVVGRGKVCSIEVEWSELLDCKQVVWPDFPAGSAVFDLTTVIRPCGQASLRIDGREVAGSPRVEINDEGRPASSAFLAFAETWIGPLADGREIRPSS